MPAIQDVDSCEAVGQNEVDSMFESYRITDQEYLELDSKFGQLCHYAAWQLLKKNAKNNHTDELEDIAQDLRMAVIRASVYYKRQVYIESCFDVAKARFEAQSLPGNEFTLKVLRELEELWTNRTRHGANRRKFGLYQEKMLEHIVKTYVPAEFQPDKSAPLRMDLKFATYCKAITWNCQKSMGKKITREKTWRTGLASLSEFDYLSSTE